ncbi:MAG: hypothetical protein ACJAUW_001936, partial [Yoonia sp.]
SRIVLQSFMRSPSGSHQAAACLILSIRRYSGAVTL